MIKLKPKEFMRNWDLCLAFIITVVSTLSMPLAPGWLFPILFITNFLGGFYIGKNL
jgi:hypothetical protein